MFLQEQINSMTDDKVKATQSCLILEEKIRNLTEDIGVWLDWFYMNNIWLIYLNEKDNSYILFLIL